MATEHDQLREQTELYALGALTDAERVVFEAHLASCALCADEVRAFSGVSAALARVVPQTHPPSALRARVLSHVASGASPGLRPAPSRVEGPASSAVDGKPDATTRTSLAPWLAVAAALALAVGLGVYAGLLRGRIGTLEVRLREAMLRVDASERQIADARRAAADAESKVAVLAAPDVTRIDLAGQPLAPRASGRAYWSRSRGVVFTASDLPALPPGRVYQLWLIPAQPAPPISAGLLRPDANGRVNAALPTPANVQAPDAMAVTIEPEGGVSAPSGAMYLLGAAH